MPKKVFEVQYGLLQKGYEVMSLTLFRHFLRLLSDLKKTKAVSSKFKKKNLYDTYCQTAA